MMSACVCVCVCVWGGGGGGGGGLEGTGSTVDGGSVKGCWRGVEKIFLFIVDVAIVSAVLPKDRFVSRPSTVSCVLQ